MKPYHKLKISEAKKADWQCPDYRRKVLASRAKTLDRIMKDRITDLANNHASPIIVLKEEKVQGGDL